MSSDMLSSLINQRPMPMKKALQNTTQNNSGSLIEVKTVCRIPSRFGLKPILDLR
jgi:hypothetical protein